jgi:hypothetical protein
MSKPVIATISVVVLIILYFLFSGGGDDAAAGGGGGYYGGDDRTEFDFTLTPEEATLMAEFEEDDLYQVYDSINDMIKNSEYNGKEDIRVVYHWVRLQCIENSIWKSAAFSGLMKSVHRKSKTTNETLLANLEATNRRYTKQIYQETLLRFVSLKTKEMNPEETTATERLCRAIMTKIK